MEQCVLGVYLFISREPSTVCKQPGHFIFISPVSSGNARAFQTLQAHLLCCCRGWRCYCTILASLGSSAEELPYQEGVQSPYKTSLSAMGQQSDLDFTFLKGFGKYRPLPSPAPCNHTQPQPTSEHQFHTQNMTQATRPQAAQGSQAERLVPSCKNHSSPKAQQNQHKEKIFDTGDFCSFVTGAAPLTSSSYALSPVTQPGLAQSLQAFYQLAPPKLGVREEMQQ